MNSSESVMLTLNGLLLFILVQVTEAFFATARSFAHEVHPEAAAITNVKTPINVTLDRYVLGTSNRHCASTCCRWHHRCQLHHWRWLGLNHSILPLQSTKHVLLCHIYTRLVHRNSHYNVVHISSLNQ